MNNEALLASVYVVLTVVYVYGGLAKLRCPRLLRGTLLELGMARPAAIHVSRIMPVVELAGGVALLVTDGWWRRVVVALLSLVLVGGLFAAWLGRGRSVPCACLGPGDTAQLGRQTLVRNGLLLAISGLALLPRDPSVMEVVTATPSGAAHGMLVAGATAAALHLHLGLTRQEAALGAVPAVLGAIQQVPIHQATSTDRLPREVANLTVHDLDGRVKDLRTLTEARPQALLITEPDCGACAAVLPHVIEMQNRVGELADVRVLALEPLCSHPAPDDLPPGTLFATDPLIGRMWTSALLAPGTPVSCVLREGLVMTHDALSDMSDPEAFISELRRG